MSLTKFDYYAPERVEDACRLLMEKGEGAMVMAGGTDLLIKIQRGLLKTQTLIDLQKIESIHDITFDKDKGLSIGAMARLNDVANHPVIKEKFPAVSEAALATANVQIRNMGTVVGNLCNAAPSADNAPVLMAMGAVVNLVRSNGERQIPLEAFFQGPGLTVIQKGEIVTSVFVPTPPAGSGASYQHISARGKVDISAVCVGVMLTMKGKTCQTARIVLGAVAPVPMRALRAEKVIEGNPISKEVLEKAGIEASKECKPISDLRAAAEYRKILVGVLTARAVNEAAKRASKKPN
ncbi:MAG: xanthine dehydrogenase family protein subunit M [Deltaproteobacteria bacterium]|nr:xanthine dehydrogenase family protein subunit M [Deltaproteobacteria bacterium]